MKAKFSIVDLGVWMRKFSTQYPVFTMQSDSWVLPVVQKGKFQNIDMVYT